MFAILLAERLFMDVPSAQAIKVRAVRGPRGEGRGERGSLRAAQDGRRVQRESAGFKMVSSINENSTPLSGSHLMENFVLRDLRNSEACTGAFTGTALSSLFNQNFSLSQKLCSHQTHLICISKYILLET